MTTATLNTSYRTNTTITGSYSFGFAVRDAFNATSQKIKDIATSPIGQGIIGAGLGVGMHRVYGPLTEKIVKTLGASPILSDPFRSLSLGCKILLTPLVCVLGPIWEEEMFRGDLQEALKNKLGSFYTNLGFADFAASIAARVTSVFFASVIFGVTHFSNALVFWCNPILFLPQVIAATFMGLILGAAKEFSGELFMPIGMHIGNNALAWTVYMTDSL